MRRRGFIQAVLAAAVAGPAAIIGHTMGKADLAKEEENTYVTKAEANAYYRVTCEEVLVGMLTGYIGEKKVWQRPRRTMSWITKTVPEVGSTVQMKKEHKDMTEEFTMEVVSVEEMQL